ncbi:MAG TPA: MarR family transcriptional regulator [Micromonosporaceae bacterium]|nr:MarR family transcriptional regulator [Micromonosporaceae bacterium]
MGYQVNLLARLLEQALRREIAAHGVVPGQFPALLNLYEEDGLTQAELTRRVGIEQPTMANTLQRMERDGLIERIADPSDRRRVRIHLTRHSRQLQSRLAKAGHEVNSQAVAGLRPNELAAFMKTLRRLVESLEALPKES